MLKIEEIEGAEALYVVTDDENAENAALDEAIMEMAPHLHEDYIKTDVEYGVLKWRVQRSEYNSLLEVLDALEGIDPDDVLGATLLVDAKAKEVVE